MAAPAAQDGEAASPQASAYLAPPQAEAVAPHDALLRVVGRAPPSSTVEITSPEGERMQVRADAQGVWRVKLPYSRPRLFALSAEAGGRLVHADGALVTTPGALAPAVVVRAGDAATPLLSSSRAVIATVDYDPSGVGAVAGAAAPDAPVTLLIDGATAAVGHADRQGRYALLAANRRLGLGLHQIEVRAPGGAVRRTVALAPAEPLAAPYQARPALGGGWQVDWALTGGGEQTTLVLGP